MKTVGVPPIGEKFIKNDHTKQLFAAPFPNAFLSSMKDWVGGGEAVILILEVPLFARRLGLQRFALGD